MTQGAGQGPEWCGRRRCVTSGCRRTSHRPVRATAGGTRLQRPEPAVHVFRQEPPAGHAGGTLALRVRSGVRADRLSGDEPSEGYTPTGAICPVIHRGDTLQVAVGRTRRPRRRPDGPRPAVRRRRRARLPRRTPRRPARAGPHRRSPATGRRAPPACGSSATSPTAAPTASASSTSSCGCPPRPRRPAATARPSWATTSCCCSAPSGSATPRSTPARAPPPSRPPGCSTAARRPTWTGSRTYHLQWMSRLDAIEQDDGHLLMHSDTTAYLDYGDSIEAVNDTVHDILTRNDADECWDLFRKFTKRFAFRDERRRRPSASCSSAYGGQRVVHGHSPIPYLLGEVGTEDGEEDSRPRGRGSARLRRRTRHRDGRRSDHGRKTAGPATSRCMTDGSPGRRLPNSAGRGQFPETPCHRVPSPLYHRLIRSRLSSVSAQLPVQHAGLQALRSIGGCT